MSSSFFQCSPRLIVSLLAGTVLTLSPTQSQDFWQKTTFPGRTWWMHPIAVGPAGEVYASGSQGVYRTTDDGAQWTMVLALSESTDVISLAVHPGGAVFGGMFMSGSPIGGLLRSTDHGGEWTRMNVSNLGYYAVAIDGNGAVIAGSEYGGVFRSSDEGESWSSLWNTAGMVWSLGAGPAYGILAGRGDSGMYRSTDDGATWHQRNTGFPWAPAAVFDIAAASNGQMFAAVDSIDAFDETPVTGGVFRSVDQGDSWSLISAGLADSRVICVAVDSGGLLYGGTFGGGLFRSSDQGSSWSSGELPGHHVYSIVTSTNGYVYAATDSGVYRSIQPTLGVGGPTGMPAAFALSQNYPNPFNPSTTIRYDLPARAYVSLKVYDVLGRAAATMVDGRQEPGYHSVEFDAGKLPSGVYFYRLNAGNFVRTMKMQVVR